MLPVNSKPKGFSLIELLIVLSVMTILLGLAAPGFKQTLQKTSTKSAANQFLHQYQYAKQAAIGLQKTVIYCATDTSQSDLTGTKCGKDWTKGAVIFQDADGNYTIDQAEDILAMSPASQYGVQIVMRAGLNKQYFRILSRGFLENTAGSMIFCSADNEAKHAQVVIFSRNGRMRMGADKNKDGIPENAEGQPISCPP